MPPLPDRLLVPLTRRFRVSLARIDAQATPQLVALWNKLPAYDEASVAEFERRARPLFAATKTAAFSQSVGYYALTAGLRPPSLRPRDVAIEPDTRGPFIQTWAALKNGDSYEGAVAAGLSRAEALVTNFISSTSRQTGDAVYREFDVRPEWLREPEPDACDWCAEMAQNTYASAEACDFGHDRCSCIAVPSF